MQICKRFLKVLTKILLNTSVKYNSIKSIKPPNSILLDSINLLNLILFDFLTIFLDRTIVLIGSNTINTFKCDFKKNKEKKTWR